MKNNFVPAFARAKAITKNTFNRFKAAAPRYGKAMMPAFLMLAVTVLTSPSVFAQGPIFTGDSANLSNIIREALKLGAIILFCLGAFFVGWAIYNKGTGKEFGNQAFGGICSFAFGTIVAVFWQIAQGRAVSVDTNF